VIVIPEGGGLLLERVSADAGFAGDEPVVWRAVVFGRRVAAVKVDAGTHLGEITPAAVERVVDGQEVLGGKTVDPLDVEGPARVDID
jgi:hypothetical protein